MSRLRCPLRIPGVKLGKDADRGAGIGAGCLVSMGCGMAFGAVLKVLGSADDTSSVMFDMPINAQAPAQCHTEGPFSYFFINYFAETIPAGLREDW